MNLKQYVCEEVLRVVEEEDDYVCMFGTPEVPLKLVDRIETAAL